MVTLPENQSSSLGKTSPKRPCCVCMSSSLAQIQRTTMLWILGSSSSGLVSKNLNKAQYAREDRNIKLGPQENEQITTWLFQHLEFYCCQVTSLWFLKFFGIIRTSQISEGSKSGCTIVAEKKLSQLSSVFHTYCPSDSLRVVTCPALANLEDSPRSAISLFDIVQQIPASRKSSFFFFRLCSIISKCNIEVS
jgi:hypothetical protein